MARSHCHTTGWALDGLHVLDRRTGTCLLIRSYIEMLAASLTRMTGAEMLMITSPWSSAFHNSLI